MKQAQQGLYEVYLMLSPTLSETARESALKRAQASIEHLGGKIAKNHDLGHRKLTYPIKKHREAYCYLTYFHVDGAHVRELDHEYKLNEDLIRFMIVKSDKVVEKLEYKALEGVTSEK